jgi:FkbM family methyltransferase
MSKLRQTHVDKYRDIFNVLGEVTYSGDTIAFRDIKFPFADDQDYFLIMLDTFCIYLANKTYSRENVDFADTFCDEGSYLMDNGEYSIMIKQGDLVFDVGAWYGDFAALAAVEFGAVVYAFEPDNKNYDMLQKTIDLNAGMRGEIIPVKVGVGANKSKAFINLYNQNWRGGADISEKHGQACDITTIDDFVHENNVQKVDFIKADIEGFEREMLKGATATLRTFAPKISICTYHLPDDPQILRDLIQKANPAYKFEQRRKKLFAWVENEAPN